MPTYDYRCTACRGLFEATHRIHESSPPCPECGGVAQRVYLCAPAVHGEMARGREAAVRTLAPPSTKAHHGPHCPCCHAQSGCADKVN